MKSAPHAPRLRADGCLRSRSKRAGFSLIETLVAVVLISLGLLALLGAMTSSVRSSSLGRQDVVVSAMVTRVADSLTAEGWGNVSSGSRSGPGFTVAWQVKSESADLDRVDLWVGRRKAAGYGTITDTVTLYLSNPAP